MSKRIAITAQMTDKIRKVVDDPNMDTSSLAIFEATAINTKPIRKGGIWEKAVFSDSSLSDMKQIIDKDGLPLLIMHDSGMLPVGRVFDSTLVRDSTLGTSELRTLFYIPMTSDDNMKLIGDIESNVISEVSISVSHKHMYCSECGWDYLGEDSGLLNFFDRTCNNGHTIGEGGVHLRLVGVKDMYELSLVNRGGAQDAKILSRAKQAMSQDHLEKLAASGIPVDVTVLTLTHELNSSPTEEKKMDMKDLVEKVATLSAELAQSQLGFAGLTKEVEGFKTQLAEKDSEIAALKDKLSAEPKEVTELKDELKEAKAALSSAQDFLKGHVQAAMVALGEAGEIPSDLMGQLKLVEDKGLKLHQLIGSEAKSTGEKVDLKAQTNSTKSRAFRRIV